MILYSMGPYHHTTFVLQIIAYLTCRLYKIYAYLFLCKD